MKVTLVGSLPPPRGGISVHIQRLKTALCNQGIDVDVYQKSNEIVKGGRIKRKIHYILWLLYFLIKEKPDIIHIHLNRWTDRAFFVGAGKLRKIRTILTVHSLRENAEGLSPFQKMIISYVGKNTDHIIAVGEDVQSSLLCDFKFYNNISTLPAFIPPDTSAAVYLPEQVEEFIRNHQFIVAANASNMDFYNNVDIYGLDMLIELCNSVRDKNTGFIYCLSNMNHEDYFQKMKARIRELNLDDNFLIVLDDMEFWPVLQKSHLFLRPTCTDSFGVSIAEALALGIPSIASDVCERPEGTILFKSRDQKDLYDKVCQVTHNYDYYKDEVQNWEYPSCVPSILKIYRELIV